MKQYGRKGTVLFLIAAMFAAQAVGCAGNKNEEQTTAASTQESQAETTAESEADGQGTEEDQVFTVSLKEGGEKSISFDAADRDADWNADTVTGLVLTEDGITVVGNGADASGSVAVIHEGGTYVVSGALEDGQIRIEAGDGEVVHLVLNGVELSNLTTAPIYGADKTKVVLTLEKGSRNIIRDESAYVQEEDPAAPDGEDALEETDAPEEPDALEETDASEEPDAPIFINGDLTINGEGTLDVQGNYQSGIRSGGNLKVVSGTIMIDSQDHGLKGKDSVIIRNGDLTIRSVKDGIKSDNEDDEEKGFIWIEDGTIRIAAQDDGIQAETALIVNGGSIDITESEEGLAGKSVDIFGGEIRAVTRDDGINSAASVETEREKMMDQEGVYTRIAGGEVWLNALADGIDSNGDFYMEGGSLYLTGPESGMDGILDYNGHAQITGGVVFAAGNSGMMQTFGEDSTQPVLVVYYSETQSAGTQIRLTDADGRELGSYSPERSFDAVIISSPDLEEGSTYHVVTGENTEKLTVSGPETVSGEAPAGGRGGMGRPDGQGRPDDAKAPERPDGADGQGRPSRAAHGDGEKRPQRQGDTTNDSTGSQGYLKETE